MALETSKRLKTVNDYGTRTKGYDRSSLTGDIHSNFKRPLTAEKDIPPLWMTEK
jgi:hypothetical protein